ncbi:hypothetical protein F4813DRAFT_370650 [Daldinia decipiens]|uniref:uncharacterized protein n=1 Tax=Daldinia decipiens TaxID=326647 RepID=UPI0020C202CD|nr:uncharacterized protein F4813DRAFT_370650 [Daldinia decipiens]KAI1654388.1 hypothetical protein F4813DRAFT_370650 [Daldinia decipiens]
MDVLSTLIFFIPGIPLFPTSRSGADEAELFEPSHRGFNKRWITQGSDGTSISIKIDESYGVVYNSKAGFSALASGLLNDNPELWYRLEGYDFFGTDESRASGQTRKKARPYLRDIKEFVKGPERKWGRAVRAIRCIAVGDGNLEVSISCGVIISKLVRIDFIRHPDRSHIATERFASELQILDHLYCNLRTRRNQKPFFLLQCQHAALNIFTNFLELMAITYTGRRNRDFDPRLSGLRRWQLEAIMSDSQLYRDFSECGSELVTTIESLLDIIMSITEKENDDQKVGLLVLDKALRGCCKDTKLRLTRFSDGLEHSLKFLSMARELNQSGNVQNLTLLATIFLPLSLAAGVLSMQSRFKDLGTLLYDFFGVVVLLATIVVLFLGAMFVLANIKELESRLLKYEIYRQFGRRLLLSSLAIIFITFGALVLSSFIVGMFKDVVLGASILGYGTLVLVFGPIVIGVLVLGIKYIVEMLKEIFERLFDVIRGVNRDQKNKQKDVEKNPGPQQGEGESGVKSDNSGPAIESQVQGSRRIGDTTLLSNETPTNAADGESSR